MADFAIVPAGQMQITDQMRKDALAAAGSIDANGRLPALYLCQSNGDLVKEGKARDKDWVVSSGDDNVVNVGTAPMFIVLAAQTRFRLTVGEDDDKRIVWDAAKGALTEAQNNDVMAKRAKRYTHFILIHLDKSGIDPSKLGPVEYNAKGMSTLAGMKWSDAVANAALRGVPPFQLAWQLGSKLEKAVQGKGSWNVLTHEGPLVLQLSEAMYAKLKDSWRFAEAKRQQGGQMQIAHAEVTHTGPSDEELGAQADANVGTSNQSVTSVHGDDNTFGDESGYATTLPGDDEAPAPAFDLPPAIPGDTLVVIGVQGGVPVKKPIDHLDPADCASAVAYYEKLVRDMHGSDKLPQVKARLEAILRHKTHILGEEPPF